MEKVDTLQLGISLWSQATTWPELLATAHRVDELGYDSLWTWDHIQAIRGDPGQPIYEGYSLLAAWAASTRRVRLGLLVGANTFRNPAIVAKSIVTIDHISGGRAILGIGAGWFEREHQTAGIELGGSAGQRITWLEESLAATRNLLDGRTVTSSPEARYEFHGLRQAPRPIQSHLPILIGGMGRQRTLRAVARYGDAWNGYGTPQTLGEHSRLLDRHCAEIGRDPAEIERTADLWMVIRDSREEALRVWTEAMAHNGLRVDRSEIAEQRPILGTPRQVAERLAEYAREGFKSAIVELPAPYDVQTVERLIEEVRPILLSLTRAW